MTTKLFDDFVSLLNEAHVWGRHRAEACASLLAARALRDVDKATLRAAAAEAKLARTEELLPCNHSRDCITSSEYVGASVVDHCGWCASIARAEAAEAK